MKISSVKLLYSLCSKAVGPLYLHISSSSENEKKNSILRNISTIFVQCAQLNAFNSSLEWQKFVVPKIVKVTYFLECVHIHGTYT